MTISSNKHKSVLLESSINALSIKPDGIYVDMTLGRGGHSELILSKMNSNGRLISIDQDIEAIQYCQNKFQNDPRIIIVKNNFVNLKDILKNLKIDFVDGIILDLGVSSPQLDNSYRGFSYKQDGPLDMRMDLSNKLTASELINNVSANELTYIFKTYGDIKHPFPVVNNIIKYRSQKRIETTMELVEIIKNSLPIKELHLSKHPAKVYFQALRIAVNDEINILKKTISVAANCLKKDGILAIISFHSLEDKIIVNEFKQLSKNKIPNEVPILSCDQDFRILNPRAILPSETELLNNKRSHSAKLRCLKKL